MDQKKFKNSTPRIKVIQKLYNSLMNPDGNIDFPKSQYKKFIKDVVAGTIERDEILVEELDKNLGDQFRFNSLDKLFQVILK